MDPCFAYTGYWLGQRLRKTTHGEQQRTNTTRQDNFCSDLLVGGSLLHELEMILCMCPGDFYIRAIYYVHHTHSLGYNLQRGDLLNVLKNKVLETSLENKRERLWNSPEAAVASQGCQRTTRSMRFSLNEMIITERDPILV